MKRDRTGTVSIASLTEHKRAELIRRVVEAYNSGKEVSVLAEELTTETNVFISQSGFYRLLNLARDAGNPEAAYRRPPLRVQRERAAREKAAPPASTVPTPQLAQSAQAVSSVPTLSAKQSLKSYLSGAHQIMQRLGLDRVTIHSDGTIDLKMDL